MSFRICFWPYDDAELHRQAGTLSMEWSSALLEDAQSRSLRPIEDPAAISLAEAVLVSGFPTRHSREETDTEYNAIKVLVQLFAIPLPGIISEYRYFDLIDQLNTHSPSLAAILSDGRPWFGHSCPCEKTYGTLPREDLVGLVANLEKAMDNDVLATIRAAIERPCDLWFTI